MKSKWRARVERDFGITDGDWSTVNYGEIDWRHWTDAEKRDLYATMTSGILNVTLANGIEARVAVAHADHPDVARDPYLRWMAMEMQLGELEAEVMAIGSRPWPPTSIEEWRELCDQLKKVLEDTQRNSTNPTKGHEALGQNKHAAVALSALERLEHAEAYYTREAGTEMDREFIREAISTAAHLGFAAGQHAYASTHKPFERFAVTGQSQTRHLGENREKGIKQSQARVRNRRARVEQLVADTKRSGEALTQWIQKKLEEEGYRSFSRATVKADQKAIKEKLSSPR